MCAGRCWMPNRGPYTGSLHVVQLLVSSTIYRIVIIPPYDHFSYQNIGNIRQLSRGWLTGHNKLPPGLIYTMNPVYTTLWRQYNNNNIIVFFLLVIHLNSSYWFLPVKMLKLFNNLKTFSEQEGGRQPETRVDDVAIGKTKTKPSCHISIVVF